MVPRPERPGRPGHDRRYAMDGTKLRGLGWSPAVGFEDGMRRTVAWYRDNQSWWRAAKDADWADYYVRQYGWRLERSVEA